MSNPFAYLLLDIGYEIKLRALEARQARDSAPRDTPDWTFLSGRVMAFNEVISIMQQTLTGFEIPLAAARLDDIDPDRDLI